MKYRLALLLLLIIDLLILLSEIPDLSITFYESELLYNSHSLSVYIANFFLSNFGNNDFSLRIPFVILHILSTILIYKISKFYSTKESDRLWLVLIYIILPGVNSAALLVDNTSLVIFLLFLVVYIWLINSRSFIYVLILTLFVDKSFIYLYISFSIFFFTLRNYRYALFSIVLIFLSYYMYGFDFGGTPKGYVLDKLGIYMALFSPIIFLYMLYSMYRYVVLKKVDILWYVSIIPFMISLILSSRQDIELQNFAPYMLLSLPIAMRMFFHSYRVRLKTFRYKYTVAFILAFIILIINILAVYLNDKLYIYLDDPKKHFAYRSHIAKELSYELKKLNIDCVNAQDNHLQQRLRFYGISKCNSYYLSKDSEKDSKNVTISYANKVVYKAHVSKVHK
jgi:hypothetical protein